MRIYIVYIRIQIYKLYSSQSIMNFSHREYKLFILFSNRKFVVNRFIAVACMINLSMKYKFIMLNSVKPIIYRSD